MNILILSWRGPGHPQEGGAELVTHEHAQAWARTGHSVYLFTSSYKGSERREVVDGVDIVRRGKQMFGVQIAAFFWYFLGKHPKFDLVVDQFHGIPFFTPLYVKSKKLAFIHEVTKEVWKLNSWPKPFNILPTLIGPKGEPWVFKLLYRKIPFMTVSESTKKDLISWGIPKKNITVIHNGVTLVLPKTSADKEIIKTAIFLGTLTADKGIEDAIMVFGDIERKDDNWKYWIVGKVTEEYKVELKKIVKKLGIEEKVKFWGYVSDKKKFELLTKAHILVNTSVREGWGLVNIEANAVGTPVIAYDVPGNRDSINNTVTGLLSKFGDTSSLASNALNLLRDQKLYNKMQKNGILWSKKFSWDKAGKESLKLIESR